MDEIDFEARRAAHRRGHSSPMRERASVDRSFDNRAEVDVLRFAAGGELTNSTIDDAIDAAVAWAVANTTAGLEGPGYVITVPAGKWTLSRAHSFPAPGDYRMPISFAGAGMNETVFLVSSDAEGSAVFTFGTESFASPSAIGFTLYLRVSGFSVVATTEGSCLRTGLRFYGPVNPHIYDVRVRSMLDAAATDSQCRGIEVLPVTVDGTELNSQFVDIDDCDIYGCLTGLFVRAAYPVSLDNVCSQACHFENAVFQNCNVTWKNSGIQGGGPLDAFETRWYGNRNMPGVVSGYDSTAGLDSGTGATCGVQTSRLCTVTGLSGLDAREDKARWLRLTPAGSSANEIKVRGVYKIERVLSATSCTIRKGSDHTSQGSLSWQVCEASGAVTLTLDNVYNEASATLVATVGGYRDSASGGSKYVLKDSEFQGGQFAIEADGITSVTVKTLREQNASTKVARLAYVSWSDIDAPIAKVEFDDHSYCGLRCLDNSAFPNEFSTMGNPRSANGGSQVRLRSALQEMGAVEIWDARVESSLSLTGADVNSITGLINGTVLTPATAGKPTWTAADAGLGGPAIVGATGSGGAARFLSGTIDSTVLPDSPYTTTIVLVGRVPDTAVVAARRVMVKTDGSFPAFVGHHIGLNDGQFVATGPYQFYRNHDNYYPNQQGQASFTLTADTDPHVFVSGAVSTNGLAGQVHSWEQGVYVSGGAVSSQPSHFVGADMTVGVGAEFGTTDSGTLNWSLVAVIPHGLSPAEHQKIVDLARNEWPLSEG